MKTSKRLFCPTSKENEVLIQIKTINNTDINTRILGIQK